MLSLPVLEASGRCTKQFLESIILNEIQLGTFVTKIRNVRDYLAKPPLRYLDPKISQLREHSIDPFRIRALIRISNDVDGLPILPIGWPRLLAIGVPKAQEESNQKGRERVSQKPLVAARPGMQSFPGHPTDFRS